MYYNEGLEKANVRDLTGAVASLRQSLKFNKNNIEARNLLGLVYFEMGEAITALEEWVLSKNMQPEKNIADDYIDKLQSNASRLASINTTIKKYNQALKYCQQDSKDLARIQLKKVLSLNPRFVRAHQLLALLYMDGEEWERAERELRKCVDIDRNNAQTLRYLKEVEDMLSQDETSRQPAKRRKEEAVRYQSENEIIIQPVNVREPKRNGGATLLNMGIGIVIGLAATYFLLVPAAQAQIRNQEQETITRISDELDAKTLRIQDLEGQIAGLNSEKETFYQQIEDARGEERGLRGFDEQLFAAATAFLETEDIHAAAAALEEIAQKVQMDEMSEGFRNLYQQIFNAIGPDLALEYYSKGYQYYKENNFDAAIEQLSKAVYYDPTHMNALYTLARSYHKNNDSENAILTYDKVIELFPGTESARYAQQNRDSLAGAGGR